MQPVRSEQTGALLTDRQIEMFTQYKSVYRKYEKNCARLSERTSTLSTVVRLKCTGFTVTEIFKITFYLIKET